MLTDVKKFLVWQPFAECLAIQAEIASCTIGDGLVTFSPGIEQKLSARRAASLTARQCANEAQRRMGGPVTTIGSDANGAPVWTPGWVGSLAHDDTHAIGLVSRNQWFSALGVDIEPDLPLPEDAATVVVTAAERVAIETLPGGMQGWARLIFGAKECVHKGANPRTGHWLEFDEVEIRIDVARNRFSAVPLTESAAQALEAVIEGVYWRHQGQLMTALAWRAI